MSSMGGGRLVGVLVAAVAALALAAPSLAADPAPELAEATSVAQAKSWAAPQIASVVLAGLMGPNIASFRPDDALTRGELHAATDHVEYAEAIHAVLSGEALLENAAAPAPWLPEVPGRKPTAYEFEWRAEGRTLHFFEYRRKAEGAS